jgi:hypothetical protein
MAVVIPSGFAQITYNWKHVDANRRWSTVIGVETGIQTAASVGETAINAYVRNLQDVSDASVALESVTVRMGPSTGPAPGITIEIPADLAGITSLQGIAANCTLLVRKLTAVGGRANRGRNYWPGLLAESMVGELGEIDPTIRDNFQVIFIDFFADLASGNEAASALIPAVILHDEASPATSPAPVAAIQVDSIVGSQRRRIR